MSPNETPVKASRASRVNQSWQRAVEYSLLCFFVTLGLIIYHVKQIGPPEWLISTALGAMAPGLACLAMIATALLAPAAFEQRRLEFPLPLTIPAMYMTFVGVIQYLGISTPPVTNRFEGVARLDQLWTDPRQIVVLFVALIVTLSLLRLVMRRSVASPDVQ